MKNTFAISILTAVLSVHASAGTKDKTVVEIAAGDKKFSTLVAAVKAAGLVDTLNGSGPFTVFAPTDEAFAKLPKGTVEDLLKPENRDKLVSILTYHVLPGKVMAADVKAGKVKTVNGSEATLATKGGATIDDAKIVATDIAGKNGVIHAIDSVIIPSPVATAPEPAQTIVEIAAGNKDFSTLVAAVKAAGLAETLSGAGPFTVFAPTNDAFAKLPKGTVEDLLKPENKEKLAGILTYHVVAGKVMAADVKAGAVKTVNGAEATISTKDGVKIDGAKVIKTDIVGSNGVIHITDSVILPPAKK